MIYLNKSHIHISQLLKTSIHNHVYLTPHKLPFHKQASQFFSSAASTETENSPKQDDLTQLKQLQEFKSGMNSLSVGNLKEADYHLRECLKIFKSINQTNTVSYIYILKKYSQVLFYLKRFDDCEKTIKASIELAKEIFKNKRELVFPYERNLIAFYTHTNISQASNYIDKFEEEVLENPDNKIKLFTFASGAIKLLNAEYNAARDKMNQFIGYENVSSEFKAYNLHNMAVLNSAVKQDYEETMQNATEPNNVGKSFLEKYGLNSDMDVVNNEILLLNKQALAELELDISSSSRSLSNKFERTAEETDILKQFLLSQNDLPKKEHEEGISTSFKHINSGLTITNIAEAFFEQGKDYEKQTAFWLKTGLKHYEKYEKENIARHLIIFSLFYSQLGQTMYAEGLYRNAIEMLKSNVTKNINYNLVFAMNMYGRLLLRQPNREKEANGIIILINYLRVT